MTPITPKVLTTGGRWELRIKLTQKSRDQYQQIKQSYQGSSGRTYSDSSFMALLLDELAKSGRV